MLHRDYDCHRRRRRRSSSLVVSRVYCVFTDHFNSRMEQSVCYLSVCLSVYRDDNFCLNNVVC